MKQIVILLMPVFIVSCSSKVSSESNEEARELFLKSTNLITEFQSKFRVAKDSASIDSLEDIFDKKITEINFSVPPETDLRLSEHENDSLYNLIKQMNNIKSQRLIELDNSLSDSICEK